MDSFGVGRRDEVAEPDDFFYLIFRDLPPDRLRKWVGPLLGVTSWEESPGFGWYGRNSQVGDLLVQVTPDVEQGCTWVGISFNSYFRAVLELI